jgi:hypothetical protein
MSLPDLSDPNIPAVLWTLVVMSVFVERLLSLIFEHRAYLRYLDGKGWKEPISFAVSLFACAAYGFDGFGLLMGSEEAGWVGLVLTAAVVSGGSKASIALFHQLLNIRSTAAKEQAAIREERIARVQAERRLAQEKGITEAQEYLRAYGYLTNSRDTRERAEKLEQGLGVPAGVVIGKLDPATLDALRACQREAGLPETGELDKATRSLMARSRCPMPAPHPVAATVEGKWPKRQIKFCFAGDLENHPNVLPSEARDCVRRAFESWEQAGLSFQFAEVAPDASPDISVDWRPAKDPDFWMNRGPIAHADYPPYPPQAAEIARDELLPVPLHFDRSEKWSSDQRADAYDIETVALHEIGHCLGLRHCSVSTAVMFASIGQGQVRRQPTQSDINALGDLYNT